VTLWARRLGRPLARLMSPIDRFVRRGDWSGVECSPVANASSRRTARSWGVQRNLIVISGHGLVQIVRCLRHTYTPTA
jgi:hypothetical protein